MRKSYLYPPHVRLGPSPVRPAPPAASPTKGTTRWRRRWLWLLPIGLLLSAPLWLGWFGTFLVASGEPRRDAAILHARGLHRALLVTDAFHSRRASLLFAAQFRHLGLEVRSTPVLDSDPDIAHWWAHPTETRRVTEEWAKLLVYLVQGAYF